MNIGKPTDSFLKPTATTKAIAYRLSIEAIAMDKTLELKTTYI